MSNLFNLETNTCFCGAELSEYWDDAFGTYYICEEDHRVDSTGEEL